MKCPACRQDLLIVEWNDVELDLCIDGHGIWFDADEIAQLFARGDADPRGGAFRDFEQRLASLPDGEHGPRRRCPRCDARMRHVAAPEPDRRSDGGAPPPVVLDACPHGDGLWFDDGELEEVVSRHAADGIEGFAEIAQFLQGFQNAVGPEQHTPPSPHSPEPSPPAAGRDPDTDSH